jgi:hypothetical protein
MDGLPNYLDNDDDGDLVLTSVEYVFTNKNVSALMDTDNDGKPNYIDNEDDGDGVLTFMEDYDGDGNPANDDTNNNGVADYLDQSNILSIGSNITENTIKLFPNPVSEVLSIHNVANLEISSVEIYNSLGQLIQVITHPENNSVDVASLQTGVYILRINTDEGINSIRFSKK